jgi:hypothetical protein
MKSEVSEEGEPRLAIVGLKMRRLIPCAVATFVLSAGGNAYSAVGQDGTKPTREESSPM